MVTLLVRQENLERYAAKLPIDSPFGTFDEEVWVVTEVPLGDVHWVPVKATQLESTLGAVKTPEG